jgi:nucleotide-binding universal stress UspA family protein
LSVLIDVSERPVEFVLHPTDLSEASTRAFHHALAIAVRLGSRFTLLHAAAHRDPGSREAFPTIRRTLAAWEAAGSLNDLPDRRPPRTEKVEVREKDAVAAVRKYVDRHPVDMLVAATAGRTGLARLLRPSTAQRMARDTKLMTLFVPAEGRPFVDGATGAVRLSRILLPMEPGTDARPAMVRAVRSAALLEDRDLEIVLLHVSEDEAPRAADAPQLPYCRWTVMERPGEVVPEILAAAEELEVDAIYLSTTWSKGGLGKSGGDVTESVIAGASCPVMAVPAHGSS